jgi:hypothetical protein
MVDACGYFFLHLIATSPQAAAGAIPLKHYCFPAMAQWMVKFNI